MLKGQEIIAYLAVKYRGQWEDIYDAIKRKEHLEEENVKEVVSNIKSHYLTIIDEEYPECLKRIYQPPFCLFYYGNLNLIKKSVKHLGVVGSREMSAYGRKATDALLKKVSLSTCIVSGLAKGVDAKAHEAAIKNNGSTIAVLGSGIERCYPATNLSLYQEIKANQLLISEYPDVEPARKEHFPMRNRLIAAFSDALLVVEAKLKSGTQITANYALQQGKDVMCVPYHIDEESVCNKLIKEGAFLVETSDEIIDILYSSNRGI